MDTFFTCICWEGVHNATHENGKYIVIYRLMHRYQKTTSETMNNMYHHILFSLPIYIMNHITYISNININWGCSHLNAHISTIYFFRCSINNDLLILGPIIIYLIHFRANYQRVSSSFWGQSSTIYCVLGPIINYPLYVSSP